MNPAELLEVIGWSSMRPTREIDWSTAYTFHVPMSTVVRYAGSWRAGLHEHAPALGRAGSGLI